MLILYRFQHKAKGELMLCQWWCAFLLALKEKGFK